MKLIYFILQVFSLRKKRKLYLNFYFPLKVLKNRFVVLLREFIFDHYNLILSQYKKKSPNHPLNAEAEGADQLEARIKNKINSGLNPG